MTAPRESKEARFRRLAEARVNKIISMLRLLGNLSWKGTYDYSNEQVEQIYSNRSLRGQKIVSSMCEEDASSSATRTIL